MKKRQVGLDLIKFIAIIGVVLLHVSSETFITSSNGWIDNAGNYFFQLLYYSGTLAVPLFFMTNGYLIVSSK